MSSIPTKEARVRLTQPLLSTKQQMVIAGICSRRPTVKLRYEIGEIATVALSLSPDEARDMAAALLDAVVFAEAEDPITEAMA